MLHTRLNRAALCALLATAAVSFVSPSTGRAEDADVKAAVDANHAAIQSGNMNDIAAVWSHAADVMLVNPRDTAIAVGWDAVKRNWQRVFDAVTGLKITQTDEPHITTMGNVSWSVGLVHVVFQLKSESQEVNYVETDVFRKEDGRWLLVSHTAKPM